MTRETNLAHQHTVPAPLQRSELEPRPLGGGTEDGSGATEAVSSGDSDVLHGDVLRGDVLHGDVLHGDVLHGDVLHGDVLHGDVLEADDGGGGRDDGAAGESPEGETAVFRTSRYDHLEPLQRAYAATAADDPARERLRKELVTGYLPLVRNIARRYHHRGEPLEDLEQVAAIGLLKAVERFDPDQGHHFLAFAVPTITGEVRRHFRDRTWAMRMPRRLKELYVSINHTSGELSAQLGRAPRPSEIATRLGMRTEEVLEGLHAEQAYRARSLDQVLAGSDDADNSGTLHDVLGISDSRFEQFVLSHSLAPHLAALPHREREILLMRFYDNMTQSQIGALIGISQMHVSRLLSTTLTRLRDAVDQRQAPTHEF